MASATGHMTASKSKKKKPAGAMSGGAMSNGSMPNDQAPASSSGQPH